MTAVNVLEVLAEALELDEGVLTLETVIEDVDEWGSIGWLAVGAVLDEQYGIELSSQTMRAMTTAGDLVDFVLKQIGAKA